MEGKVTLARRFCMTVIFALILACVCTAMFGLVKPSAHADGTNSADASGATELEPTMTYLIGDESIVGMYGAMAVDGNAQENGYYTIVDNNGVYEYTYSAPAVGWAKAMQAAVGTCVKVVIASDWIAPAASGFGTDEQAFYTDGSIYVPDGASVLLDLNGCAIDRNKLGDGRVITIGGNATVELVDSNPTRVHKAEDGDTDKYTYETTVTENNPETGEDSKVTKTVAVTGGVITSGSTTKYGAGMYVGVQSTFIMNGGTISGNTASSSGGGVNFGGGSTFIMNDGRISGNTSRSNNGGGVYVGSNSTLTISGGEISGNTVRYSGGGVYVGSNSTLTISGGEISGNTTSSGSGGGVYVGSDGTLTISGGKINGNTASNDGGGVYVGSYIMFTMTGGKISGNTSRSSSGGGVYVSNNGTFTMTGGTISGNTVRYSGGGVDFGSGSTFTMNGGEISGNTASGRYGGGVYFSSGSITMTGGKISGNTASSGGGVYFSGGITMSGGEISGNTADGTGGGVHFNNGKFTMTGGKISGNTASSGGGVYVNSGYSSQMSISGDPKIYDNIIKTADDVENKESNDVDGVMTVGQLEEGAKIGLVYRSTAATSGYAANNSAAPTEYFFSNNEAYSVALNGSGEVIMTSTPMQTLKLCYGGDDATPEEVTGHTVKYEYEIGSKVKYELADETAVQITITKDGEPFDGGTFDIADAGEYNISIVYADCTDVYVVVIAPRDITDEAVSGMPTPDSEYEYSGEAIELEIGELTYGGETLEYDVEYKNNIYPGTATATVKFKGNYSGKKTISYVIVATDGVYTVEWQYYIDGSWTAATGAEFTYIPGETLKSDRSGYVRAVLTMTGVTKYAYAANVSEYRDGNVSNANLSEVNVVFTRDGKPEQLFMNVGSYVLALSAERDGGIEIVGGKAAAEVSPFDMDGADGYMFDVRINGASAVYDGTAKTPNVTIYFDRLLLTRGTDFTVTYSDNVEGGTAKAVIGFVGNYTGTDIEMTFEIAKADNEWSGQLNIIRWAYNEFDAEHNVFIAEPKFLTDGERVHFAIADSAAARAGADGVLADIPVELIHDDMYGLCYKVTDEDAVAAINALGHGTYKLYAWVNGTGSYNAPVTVETYFNIIKAQNAWTESPSIRAWQYMAYNATDNAPTAAAKFGETELVVKDANGKVVYSTADGTDLLATQVVGEYTLYATVAESANYEAMAYELKFRVVKAQNDWTDGELPSIESWITGEYTDNNLPVANAVFGVAQIVISDGNGNVFYDSASGVNKLADLDDGTYYMTATVEASDNYYKLEYSRSFKVFEQVGMPWWGVLLIVFGTLLLIALIVLILIKLGVLQILSEKMVVAMRAKADTDATIAAVRAGKYASAAYVPAVAATSDSVSEKKEEKEEKKAMRKAAALEKKALTPEERAAELEAKAKAMRKKAEAMKAKAKVIVMTPEEKKAMKEAEKAAALEKGRVKSPEERAEALEKKAELTEEQAAQLKAKAEVMKNRANEMREKAARKAEQKNKTDRDVEQTAETVAEQSGTQQETAATAELADGDMTREHETAKEE